MKRRRITMQSSEQIGSEHMDSIFENINVKNTSKAMDSTVSASTELGSSSHFYEMAQKPHRSLRIANRKLIQSSDIYSKPRMHFTGTGKITKLQPGYNNGSITVPSSCKKIKCIQKIDVKCLSVSKTVKQEELIKELKNENDSVIDSKVSAQLEQNASEETSSESEETLSDDDDALRKQLPNKKMFSRIGTSKFVKCTLCFKQMKITSMKQHYKTHTGVKPFPCGYCSSRFTRRADAQRHFNSFHAHKMLKCSVCNKNFVDKKSLLYHLRNHNTSLYLFCTICGHKFKQQEYYDNHMRFIHSFSQEKEEKIIESNHKTHAVKQVKKQCDKDQETVITNVMDKFIKLESPDFLESESRHCLNVKEEESYVETFDYDNNSYDSQYVDSPDKIEEIYPQDISTFNVSKASVEKSTLSFIQKMAKADADTKEEELVSIAIEAAVCQAETALESIQSYVSQNMNDQSAQAQEGYKGTDASVINAEPSPKVSKLKGDPHSSEIHITASLNNRMRKFIIRLPSGCIIDASTQTGMDTLIRIVNYLCSGKGQLTGPVDVKVHHNIGL